MFDRRVLIFVGWAVLVSLGCADLAFSVPPMLGSIILFASLLAFRPSGEFTRPVPLRSAWLGILVIALLLGYIVYGAWSGETKASNEQFEHSPHRPYYALGIWCVYMFAGFRAFRAKYYPSSRAAAPSVGT